MKKFSKGYVLFDGEMMENHTLNQLLDYSDEPEQMHKILQEKWEYTATQISKITVNKIDIKKRIGDFEFNIKFLNKIEHFIEQIQSQKIPEINELNKNFFKESNVEILIQNFYHFFEINYNNYMNLLGGANNCEEFKSLLDNLPDKQDLKEKLQDLKEELQKIAVQTFKPFRDEDQEGKILILKYIVDNITIDDKIKKVLLLEALKKPGLDIIDYLLNDEQFSSNDIYSILGSSEYYGSSKEIIDELTNCSKIQNSNLLMAALHYQAMFLYNKGKYVEAITIFNKVTEDENTSQHEYEYIKVCAKYYEALCYKYIGEVEMAAKIFQEIIDVKSENLQINNIQKNVETHINKEKTPEYEQNVEQKKAVIIEEKELWKHNTFISQKMKDNVESILERLGDSLSLVQNITNIKDEILNQLMQVKQEIKLEAFNNYPQAMLLYKFDSKVDDQSNEDGDKINSCVNTMIDIDHTINICQQIIEEFSVESTGALLPDIA